MQDRAGKDRTARGIRNAGAKLTEEQVREIRRRRAAGNTTLKGLAEEFGVSYDLVFKIVHRRLWKDLE